MYYIREIEYKEETKSPPQSQAPIPCVAENSSLKWIYLKNLKQPHNVYSVLYSLI